MAKLENDKILLTQEGYNELKAEYNELVNKKRPDIVTKIQTARSLGDLSENESYHQAKHEQSFIEGRIAELEEILERAQIIKKKDNGKVQVGSKVKVKVDSDEQEFILVDESEADLKNGKISHQSPIGQALLDKEVGDVIEVDAPMGKVRYKILAVG